MKHSHLIITSFILLFLACNTEKDKTSHTQLALQEKKEASKDSIPIQKVIIEPDSSKTVKEHTTTKKNSASKPDNKEKAYHNTSKSKETVSSKFLGKVYTTTSVEKTIANNLNFNSLFTGLKNEQEEVIIQPKLKSLVELADGSSLEIPENAFIDANGKTVTQPVTLMFEKFNSAAQVIASGIPMTHQGKQFESAGMFQINGFVGDKAINIAPNKSITVNSVSTVDGEYDFYQYSNAQDDIGWANITPKPLPQPMGKDSFRLRFQMDQFPEFAPLRNNTWKLASADPQKNPRHPRNAWVLNTKFTKATLTKPKFETVVQTRLQHKDAKASLSPDGNYIVTTGKYKIVFWDWNGHVLKEFKYNKQLPKTSYKICDNTDYFTIQTPDNQIELWSFKLKRLLKTNGVLNSIYFNSNGQNIIIASKISKNQINLHFINSEGEQLNLVQLPNIQSISNPLSFSKTFGLLCAYNSNKIQLFNHQGKLIKSRPTNKEIGERSIVLFKQFRKEIIIETNSSSRIWDWEKDITYELDRIITKKEDRASVYEYLGNSKAPICIVTKYEGWAWNLWNWETNKLLLNEWQDQNYFAKFSPKGNFVRVEPYRNKTERIFNTRGKQILALKRQLNYAYKYYHKITEDEKYIISNHIPHNIAIYSSTGRLLKNIPTKNKLAKLELLEGNQFVVFDSPNTVKYYTTTGKLLKQVKLKPNLPLNLPLIKAFSSKDYYFTYSSGHSSFSGHYARWDKKGQLLNDFGAIGKPIIDNYQPSGKVLYKSLKAPMPYAIISDTNLIRDKNVYQLTLYYEFNYKHAYFTTLVYMTPQEVALYTAYLQKREERLERERKAKQLAKERKQYESLVFRSFNIQQFGLYNWDRYYKNDNVIRLAVKFDFNTEDKPDKYAIFLVVKDGGNVVIQYPESDWDRFNFDPNKENQLIAVSPNNKISLFSKRDFKSLPLSKIKREKAFTFTLRPSKTINSLEELLND